MAGGLKKKRKKAREEKAVENEEKEKEKERAALDNRTSEQNRVRRAKRAER